MKRKLIPFYVIAALLLIQGCKKTTVPGSPLSSGKQLLREITWTAPSAKAALFYNADSTLKTVQYLGPGSGYTVNYSYTQKRITAFGLDNSLYQHEFVYGSGGRISNVKRKEQGQVYTEDMEFYYDATGAVTVLKYYVINEGRRVLAASSSYKYDTDQRLSEIISIDINGSKSSISIEEYSAGFNYDPLWFLGITAGENYQIYNYPVLSSMKGVPSKIKRTVYVNGLPSTELLIASTFVITNSRIDKHTTVTSYPQNPQYNSTSDTEFKY